MAIPARSDFYVIPHFPEVYHGQEVSEALFSAAARRVTGQGRDTTSSVIAAGNTATSCVSGPLRAGAVPADPELGVFGSQWRKLKENKNSHIN